MGGEERGEEEEEECQRMVWVQVVGGEARVGRGMQWPCRGFAVTYTGAMQGGALRTEAWTNPNPPKRLVFTAAGGH